MSEREPVKRTVCEYYFASFADSTFGNLRSQACRSAALLFELLHVGKSRTERLRGFYVWPVSLSSLFKPFPVFCGLPGLPVVGAGGIGGDWGGRIGSFDFASLRSGRTGGKDAGSSFPSASFLRKQEPSVLLFTDKRKNQDAGSSITNVEDDGGGQKKGKKRRWIPDQVRDDGERQMQIPHFVRNDHRMME